MALVRKETFYSPFLGVTAVVGVGTHPKTFDLDLYVHPNKVLMFGRAMDSRIGTLFIDCSSRLRVALIQLPLQLLGSLVSKLSNSSGFLHTMIVAQSSSPLFDFETCRCTNLVRARVDW
jgi:hypothetical protein